MPLNYDAIEQWSLRLGVAKLQQPFTPEDRVLWMADHSTQIDQDKLLVIIGIRLADLPPPQPIAKIGRARQRRNMSRFIESSPGVVTM